MNLAHVEYFVTACREGRLTDAARHLHVTQQAVSAGIVALERELGVRLLDRSPAGVAPTAEGQTLLADMRDLLTAENRLRAHAATLGTPDAVSVSFAYAVCTIRTDGPHPNQADLEAFAEVLPGASLRTFEAASDACLALVAQGTADLALVAGRPEDPAYEKRFLYAPELALCVPADHPFAARDGSLSYADLRDVPQLLPPDLNFSLRTTTEACLRHGFEPMFLEMPHATGNQVDIVAAGYAVAFMPDNYEVAAENEAVRLVHMTPGEACHVPLWLAWSAQRGLSPSAAAFADYFAGLFPGSGAAERPRPSARATATRQTLRSYASRMFPPAAVRPARYPDATQNP